MTFHFSYGANMSRAVMRRHAPGASPLGAAELADHRFVITAHGYASVEPAKAESVHGVLWRITPRDRVMLDVWENINGGLYRAEMLPVRGPVGRVVALVYLASARAEGRPKPGYIELVTRAGQDWKLPAEYMAGLQRWARPLGGDVRKIGEFL